VLELTKRTVQFLKQETNAIERRWAVTTQLLSAVRV